MQEINFIKVGAENFKNYKDLITYEFINGTISIVTGPNGIGKTTIFDILPFALYGVTPSGLRSEDVVNNEIGKDCKTYVEFKKGDDLYTVERYVKHRKYGDTALISKNGEKPYKKGHREIVPEIESLICPQKLFMNTILFGQKVKNFFTDLTDSEQKDIFRKVLQLDDYVLYYDETSKRLKKLNENKLEISNEINTTKNLIENSISQINFLNLEKEKFQENQKIIISEIEKEIKEIDIELNNKQELLNKIPKDLDDDISQSKINISNLDEKLNYTDVKLKNEEDSLTEKINSKKLELQNAISEKKNEILILKESQLKNLSDDKINLEDLKLKLENSKLIVQNLKKDYDSENLNLSKIKKEINEIEKNISKEIPICITCKQKIGEDQIEIFKNLLLEKEEDCNNITKNITNIELEVNKESETKNFNNEKFTELREKIVKEEEEINSEYQKNITELNNKINETSEKINSFFKITLETIRNNYKEEKDKIIKNVESYKEKLNSLIKELSIKNSLENEINAIQTNFEILKSKLESEKNKEYDLTILKSIITNLNNLKEEEKKQNIELSKIVKEYEATEFWKSGFSSSGIPSILIDEAIPEMNRRIKYYMEQMGSRYLVSFDTLSETKGGDIRDKISVNVLDTITKSNNRKGFSGGQIRLVDIAVLLTLSDIQSLIQNLKTNVLLLDEIFDSLDEENISYVSKLLRKICKDKSINIISHTIIDQLEADHIFKLG